MILLVSTTGCATERAVVAFSYKVEPDRGLPPGMTTLAITPAKVGPNTDPKWSDLGAGIVQSLVSASRAQYGTEVAVSDRRDTQVTFDEADLAAAGMSTGTPGAGGRLLSAEGVILSNINVKVERHRGQERTISGVDLGALWGRHARGGRAAIYTDEVETITRNLTVQTDFRLIDSSNNQVWEQYQKTLSATDRTSASPLFGSSRTEASLTPADRIIRDLVEQGAREFLSRLIPCRIDVMAEVESSGNAHCANGVRLLRAQAYEEALTGFQSALTADGRDHRAAFGAGVACEALGRYDEALTFYRRASALRGDPAYLQARNRLNIYGSRAAPSR